MILGFLEIAIDGGRRINCFEHVSGKLKSLFEVGSLW